MFFRQTTNFDEAFPTLEDVIIEYRGSGQIGTEVGTWSPPEKHKIRMRKIGGAVRCGDPECHGGYEFDLIVHEMLGAKKLTREGKVMCRGVRGTPKLRKVYGSCLNSIMYRIQLIPKQE